MTAIRALLLCSCLGLLRPGGGQPFLRLRPSPSDNLPVKDIVEHPDPEYDPKEQDLDERTLRKKLGSHFDPGFMAVAVPGPANASGAEAAAGAGAGGAARRAAAPGAGSAPGTAPQGGQEGAAEGAAVALGVHLLPRALHLEGPGRPLLAPLHQGGQLLRREVLLAARGHVLQARQVGHQDLPALALPGLVQPEVLHLDPRAVPAHLRVQVLLL
ncbi:unnamed protein product, partial [Bubo scandiacus]